MQKTKKLRKRDTNRKGKQRNADVDEEDDVTSKRRTSKRTIPSRDNDPSWYAANEFMLRDAASIPFSNRAGLPVTIPRHSGGTVTAALNSGKITFPSVCGLALSLTPGVSENADSPVNVAARNIYAYVRHANSGHANYDAPNLMLFLLSMDSLFSIYGHCARMYGLLRTYSARNAALPRALFAACGWDYDDFMYNQVQFRLYLNTFAQKVGSMCVPGSMTYMARHLWLFQNVFQDAPISKAALYMYFPYEVYEYAPIGAWNDNAQLELQQTPDTPGLIAHPICYSKQNMGQIGGKMKFARLAEILDLCVESLMSSEDLGIMSGDILKAFGPENVWRLVPIHEDFEVLPVYSEEVLQQIHNIQFIGEPVWEIGTGGQDDMWYDGFDVSAVKEFVDPNRKVSYLYSPAAYWITNQTKFIATEAASQMTQGDTFLNMHQEDVGPGDVMVATRLIPRTYTTTVNKDVPDGTSTKKVSISGLRPLSTGSDVCRFATIVVDAWNGGAYDPVITYWDTNFYGLDPSTSDNFFNFAKLISRLEAITDHPILYSYKRGDGTAWTLIGVHGDIENWTTVAQDVVTRMHEVALLSQFNVPLMGSWNQKVR